NSTRSAPGGGFIRTQFANNIIPKTAIDVVGANAASFYPLPNGPGDACSGGNNFTGSGAATSSVNQPSVRVDYYMSPKDRIFVRISRSTTHPRGADIYKTIPRPSPPGPDIYKTIARPSSTRLDSWFGDNGTASYMRTINSGLIAETRFGL